MMSLLRRPVLLLSVAATVTVPGALAAFAVLGHNGADRAPMARAESSAAQPGSRQHAGALLTSPQAGSAAQAELLPGLTLAGQGTAPPDMREGAAPIIIAAARRQLLGTQLLQEAAKSGAATSYEGVEMISDAAVGGTVTVMATVWHRGGVTVTRAVSGQAAPARAAYGAVPDSGQPNVSYDGDGHEPEGVFGLTTALVRLLAKNYVAVYEGEGTVLGRPALIVGVRRADGSLAAQFWLDRRTMLPMRRDVYDTHAHLVSDEKFVQVRFGQTSPPAGQGSAKPATAPTWTAAPVPAAFLARLNRQGWRLPAALPGNLGLYAAAETSTASGQVVDLGFSDGLSVISLFAQRGTLPATMPGWQPVRIGGHSAYVAGHEVALSAQGLVYTLVADAPLPVVDDAVAVLPPERQPGVLGRIRRGFDRLVTLVDPFRLGARLI